MRHSDYVVFVDIKNIIIFNDQDCNKFDEIVGMNLILDFAVNIYRKYWRPQFEV